MADFIIPAGKYLTMAVDGTGSGGSNDHHPLLPGSISISIATADQSRAYVALVSGNIVAFVAKTLPPVGQHMNFTFTVNGADAASGNFLPTFTGTGQIAGPDPLPQVAINLAFSNAVAVDPAVTPPPADDGTGVAHL